MGDPLGRPRVATPFFRFLVYFIYRSMFLWRSMRVAVDVGNGATGCPEARFRLNTVYRAEGSSARETDMGRRARS